MRTLALHEWGERGRPRVVFLHGLTSHGGHARDLAERWLADRYHVVAPDLLGHGSSPWEPPWSLAAHVDAILGTVGAQRSVWLGHSFGCRLALEVAARRSEAVERLILLDPAVHLPEHVALFAAENARRERSYSSFAEAVDRRYDESQLHSAPRELVEEELRHHLLAGTDGRWRYRYCQSAVVAGYGELASAPPPFETARVPTLLLLGERSYVPYDHLLGDHALALAELLQTVRVPGGHTVLWDSLEATATSIEGFLALA